MIEKLQISCAKVIKIFRRHTLYSNLFAPSEELKSLFFLIF